MAPRKYIKYPIDYNKLYRIIDVLGKKKLNIFVDIQSICTGFYNRNNVFSEMHHYIEHKEVSDILLHELRDFLNSLYKKFKRLDPFFVLFYDDGYCEQNRVIDNSYKNGRANVSMVLLDDQVELYRQIKQYYYAKIEGMFTKPDLSKVFYLRKYEADFIPHYCVTTGLYDTQDGDMLNVILSNDKDLMQTCRYKNTIQLAVTYNQSKAVEKRHPSRIFDDDNAVTYINKKIQRGILTSKYIPMILSLAGDKSDEIKGIKGIGEIKACNNIISHSIPPTVSELKQKLSSMPEIITNNIDLIEKNFKMIDFDEQLKRVNMKQF